MLKSFVIAAAQATPVFLDRKATMEKACDWIAEAGRNGARLIVFPEAFIPAYPDWVWALSPGTHSELMDELYVKLVENSISVPDESTEELCRAAKLAGVHVIMGLNERNREASNASLYNTIIYIDDQGTLLGKHRKLVPTGGERLVWAPGDGSTLAAYPSSIGVLGGLICWENYMPLARNSLYAWGTQIYAAATWDYGDVWQSTLKHISKEGGMYVIGACMPLHLHDIPNDLGLSAFYPANTEWINPGDSIIVSPMGEIIAGPAHECETILFAEVDLSRVTAAKRKLDVTGHYGRPDVFKLSVNRQTNPMLIESTDG
jgi:nitrilase